MELTAPTDRTTTDGTAYDLVVSLGAQEYRFDRLVEWIEHYLADRPDVRCLLQHGFTRPSALARSELRVPRPQLLENYRRASAVVVHGGPASILDARGLGIRPVAVPRRAALGEHVDDHQMVYTRFMADTGEVVHPASADELAVLVDLALARPSAFRTEPRTGRSGTATAVPAAWSPARAVPAV